MTNSNYFLGTSVILSSNWFIRLIFVSTTRLNIIGWSHLTKAEVGGVRRVGT